MAASSDSPTSSDVRAASDSRAAAHTPSAPAASSSSGAPGAAADDTVAPPDAYSPLAPHWSRLDRSRVFLNHGSFGAVPDAVIQRQRDLRDELEADPVAFMVERLEPMWCDARNELARFVGADPADMVFVVNATTGVNAVLRSLHLEPGDEILTNTHEYNACVNAARFVTRRVGARVVEAPLGDAGGRVDSPEQIVEQTLDAVTPRTKLAMLSHVTSPTGLVLPIETLVRELEQRGVPVLVDGAHALAMLSLDLDALGASYYTANCHKWLCSARGAAFLHVRRDRAGDWHELDIPGAAVRPLTISHGANSSRRDIPRLHVEFDWQGTTDPTPPLCVPAAIAAVAAMHQRGWHGVMQHNRELALAGRRLLIDRLALEPMGPESMIGSLAALRLPDRPGGAGDDPPGMGLTYPEALQRELVAGRWSKRIPIQAPIIPWTTPAGAKGGRLVRLSAHLYNAPHAYELLAEALAELMHRA